MPSRQRQSASPKTALCRLLTEPSMLPPCDLTNRRSPRPGIACRSASQRTTANPCRPLRSDPPSAAARRRLPTPAVVYCGRLRALALEEPDVSSGGALRRVRGRTAPGSRRDHSLSKRALHWSAGNRPSGDRTVAEWADVAIRSGPKPVRNVVAMRG